jgi:choline-sulfatase
MPDPAPDRPNILFLMADEHRADVAGFAGNDIIRTPTLDRLAASGVVFQNAYTPSPICIPCRQAMAAGQLPRTCSVEKYGQDLPPFSMTFAHRLSQHGYHTTCCGKLHHVGQDQMQGWRQRVGSDTSVAADHIPGFVKGINDDRPGRGDGKWSDTKEIKRAGVSDTHPSNDAYTLDGALTTIDRYFLDTDYDRPADPAPLLLKISFNRPHYPYFCDRDRFEYYLNRVQPFIEHEAFDHPFLAQRQVVPGRDVSVRELTRCTAAYYGMIDAVDHDFARVLERLERAGQNLDDWIVVYTADHGEMLGEHGIWEKQKFFEASARVPLIIRWPERFAPRVVNENVNLCDLFATLCELTGVPLPADEDTVRGAGLDSRSLAPLMAGDAAAWHETHHNETVSQFGGTNLMIKRDALKYQWYDRPDCRDQPEVLFDLIDDPGERRNAIGDPQHADAVAEFRQRRDALGFEPAPR